MEEFEKIIEKNKKYANPKLNLGGLGLKEIPEEVFKLTHLETLILGDWMSDTPNAIEVIPDRIANLNKLKTLDFRRNKIKEIPKSLFQLENLRTLDLNSIL